MTFRVTTYLDVNEPLRPMVQGILIAGMQAFPSLESEVNVGEAGVEVTSKVEADSERTAAAKARYWIEKAAKRTKGVRFTGKTTQDPKVELWT